MLLRKERLERQADEGQGQDKEQEGAAVDAQLRQAPQQPPALLAAQPQKDGQAKDREAEQETEEPQVIAQGAKPDRCEPPIAVKHEVQIGAPQQPGGSFVPPLEIEHRRHQQERADEERDQQALEAFAGKGGGAAAAQGEIAAGAGQQEEERHAPRVQKGDQQGDGKALLGILDVPGGEIERMDGVKEKHPQDGQHTQPVEIMEPAGDPHRGLGKGLDRGLLKARGGRWRHSRYLPHKCVNVASTFYTQCAARPARPRQQGW